MLSLVNWQSGPRRRPYKLISYRQRAAIDRTLSDVDQYPRDQGLDYAGVTPLNVTQLPIKSYVREGGRTEGNYEQNIRVYRAPNVGGICPDIRLTVQEKGKPPEYTPFLIYPQSGVKGIDPYCSETVRKETHTLGLMPSGGSQVYHLGCYRHTSALLSKRLVVLFRGEITPLSSSYNISGLVPVCWLLFQCF